METPILRVETRSIIGKKVKLLRLRGLVPAVIYGHEVANQHVAAPLLAYEKVFHQAGTSALVDVVVDDRPPIKVLLHEPQYHPTKGVPLHADLYAVKMTEKLQTEIPLHFIGESEAVETLGGTLSTPLDTVQVECYPDKLVPAIDVDVASLKIFDDVIRVSDIVVPSGIAILNEPAEVVAIVIEPRSEEELAALEEVAVGEAADKAAVEAVEVEQKDREDEAAE